MPEILSDEFKDRTPLTAYPCPVCGEPMYLAPGQIQGSHRKCRAEFKKIRRKQIALGFNPDDR